MKETQLISERITDTSYFKLSNNRNTNDKILTAEVIFLWRALVLYFIIFSMANTKRMKKSFLKTNFYDHCLFSQYLSNHLKSGDEFYRKKEAKKI